MTDFDSALQTQRLQYQTTMRPGKMINGPGMRTNLNSYYPGSNNDLTCSPNFVPLPFDGNGNIEYILGQGNDYRDDNLLGVVGHSPEQIAYYQRNLPLYIPAFYPNIPLTHPQNEYMTEETTLYSNFYTPNVPVFCPQTVFPDIVNRLNNL